VTDTRALEGVTVVVTRRPEDVGGLTARVQEAGGGVLCVPMIEFTPPADPTPLERARARVAEYDWLVLTSRYAARALLAELPVPAEGRARVAALGKSTAELINALGWPVDVDGGGEGADALAERLASEQDLAGAALLYPRSNLARSRLPATLRRAGAKVREVEAYRNQPPGPQARDAILRSLDAGPAVYVFASPSAAQHLDAILAERERAGGAARDMVWSRLVTVSIGPTTTRALRQLGAGRRCEASTPDDDGLMAALRVAAAYIAERSEHQATGEK